MSRVLVTEPIDISLTRAVAALRMLKTEMAIYFSEGQLKASQKESSDYKKQILIHANDLVGIYKHGNGISISQIYDDIAEFYK